MIKTSSFILMWLMLGCAVDWRAQLDQTAVYTPSPPFLAEVRGIVQEEFRCPEGSTHAYVLAEIDLATHAGRAGIRCE